MSGIISDNLGRSSGLVKAAGGGKVLQIANVKTTSVISSTNNLGGKEFPSNTASTDGTQIVTLSMTPQSTTSHFYVWFTCASGVGANGVPVCGIYCGTTLLNLCSGNGYSADVDGMSVHGTQDTTSLSGSQTIQARNLGTHDGSAHKCNANSGGASNGGTATMTVMEIED